MLLVPKITYENMQIEINNPHQRSPFSESRVKYIFSIYKYVNF